MPKHRIDITYEIWTEDDRESGEYSEAGFVDPAFELFQDERPAHGWSLRHALAYMTENSGHIETCWTPGQCSFSLYGYGAYVPGEDTQNQAMHIAHRSMSEGSKMRLARVLARNGVYFANMRGCL